MNYIPRHKKFNIIKKDKKLFSKYKKPYKHLISKLKTTYGKTNGQIVHKRLKGAKKMYRHVLHLGYKKHRKINDLIGLTGTVLEIQRDPYRSAPLALVKFPSRHEYIFATDDMKEDDKIHIDTYVDIASGNRTLIKNIPINTKIHNIEAIPLCGGKYVRAAGGYATVVGKREKHVVIKMPSSEEKLFPNDCWCSIGVIGREHFMLLKKYKAGQSFHCGICAHNRGVAMNPVDHVHGGGEGKTGTKGPQRNATGSVQKGQKTAELTKRRPSKRLIVNKRTKRTRK